MIEMKTWCIDYATIGMLEFNGFKCFTLELPWQNNRSGVSCIKSGEYNVVKYVSPSNGNVLLLQDVENRTHIQIHAGNYTRNVKGCILVGDSIKFLDDDGIPDVTNSKNTLARLIGRCEDEEIIRISRVADYDFMSV